MSSLFPSQFHIKTPSVHITVCVLPLHGFKPGRAALRLSGAHAATRTILICFSTYVSVFNPPKVVPPGPDLTTHLNLMRPFVLRYHLAVNTASFII